MPPVAKPDQNTADQVLEGGEAHSPLISLAGTTCLNEISNPS